VFIAISPPDEVKDELEKAQAAWRVALPQEGVRWTKRGQFHLTLTFLGDVESSRLEALVSSVRRACGGFGVLQLRVGRIGFFPDRRHPRVIWAEVLDVPQRLPLLQRTVEAATARFTSQERERTFTGHVTLGRCKGIARPEVKTLTALTTEIAPRGFGEWSADNIEIIRSELASDGSRYRILAVVPLTAITEK